MTTLKTLLLETTTVAFAPVPDAELIGTFVYVPFVYAPPWLVIPMVEIDPTILIGVGPKPTPSSLSVVHCSRPLEYPEMT